jgi:histidyl-tRNA synthetase
MIEVELLLLINTVYKKLGINIKIHFNNRKVLSGIAERVGAEKNLVDLTNALDKIEKIGLEESMRGLRKKGIHQVIVDQLIQMIGTLQKKEQGKEMVSELRQILQETKTGGDGVDEVELVFENLGKFFNNENVPDIIFDIALARGLDYYTSSIIEVKAKDVKMGSIGGGGRYDDLTGLFGVPNIPGVGISFGVDRIYDVMEELKLFPEDVQMGSTVLFFNLGEQEANTSFKLLQQLRAKGISGEICYESSKFEKQFKYAEKKNIPFVIIIGAEEITNGTCKIKNLQTREEKTIKQDQLINFQFH